MAAIGIISLVDSRAHLILASVPSWDASMYGE